MAGTEHLCKQAEAKLVFLRTKIKAVSRHVQKRELKDLLRMDTELLGYPYPMLQVQMDELTRHVSAVRCLIAVTGEDRTWLKKFLKRYRDVQTKFKELSTDITYQMILVVFCLGLDTANNAAFHSLYGKCFAMVPALLNEALPYSATRNELTEFIIGHKTLEYMQLSPMDRFIPDAGSLGVYALVTRVGVLMRGLLFQWDCQHGLALGPVRRVFEILACQLEASFEQGEYNILPLLQRASRV